jgi:hypothetical protein
MRKISSLSLDAERARICKDTRLFYGRRAFRSLKEGVRKLG